MIPVAYAFCIAIYVYCPAKGMIADMHACIACNNYDAVAHFPSKGVAGIPFTTNIPQGSMYPRNRCPLPAANSLPLKKIILLIAAAR